MASAPARRTAPACNDQIHARGRRAARTRSAPGSTPMNCSAGDTVPRSGRLQRRDRRVLRTRPRRTGRRVMTATLAPSTSSCQAGVCTGANPVTCTASDQCHIAGACNPSTGVCSNPAARPTALHVTATTRAREHELPGGHVHGRESGDVHGAGPVPRGRDVQSVDGRVLEPGDRRTARRCNDGNECTQTDTCQRGRARAANAVTCTAQDQCHVGRDVQPGDGRVLEPGGRERDERATTGTRARRRTRASRGRARARTR